MPMRTCKTVMAEIDRIADGEATRGERVRFAMHLGMCAHCDRYYRQYVAVRDALGNIESTELPPDFEDVMRGLLKLVEVAADDSN